MSKPTFLHENRYSSLDKSFTNQLIVAVLSDLLMKMALFGINFVRLQDRD
jgi:hypothetical protein